MTVLVPSYIYKVARAKKHLIELDEAVSSFAAQRPYRVIERMEGKKKPRLVRRLTFTGDPSNGDIPIIAADVIYNLRSALDHLMSALVANKDRRSAMFPIYFDGVWEAIVPGENQQRVKERVRWASDTKTIHRDAVAILKALQPPDAGGDQPHVSMLEIINTLSNRDRHEKLPVVASGLKWPILIEHREADDTPSSAVTHDPNPDAFLKDHAEITGVPHDAMDVQVTGTPVVAINLGGESRYAVIPEKLAVIARYIEEMLIPRLIPYVRAH